HASSGNITAGYGAGVRFDWRQHLSRRDGPGPIVFHAPVGGLGEISDANPESLPLWIGHASWRGRDGRARGQCGGRGPARFETLKTWERRPSSPACVVSRRLSSTGRRGRLRSQVFPRRFMDASTIGFVVLAIIVLLIIARVVYRLLLGQGMTETLINSD